MVPSFIRSSLVNDFRQLSDGAFASPQIEIEDIAAARELGIGLIVNNRPDGEDPSAPQGDEIEAAARAAGLDYCAIPVGHAGFGHDQIDGMREALATAQGPVLAYCRSGTRSTLLWAMASAKNGEQPDAIAEAASRAGYDVAPVRPMLDMLASQAAG